MSGPRPRGRILSADEADRVGDVFSEHQRFIENVARQHAPRPDDVPDIVQAVGVNICTGLNGFRGDSEIKTWLYRVTVNTARVYYRRELRFRRAVEATANTVPDPSMEPRVDPDQQAAASEALSTLMDKVDRLRPIYQQAIRNVVKNALGETVVETVENKNTRRKRLWQARRRLRELGEG